jgi:hypothetical protein
MLIQFRVLFKGIKAVGEFSDEDIHRVFLGDGAFGIFGFLVL